MLEFPLVPQEASMRSIFAILGLAFTLTTASAQTAGKVPTIDDLINLKRAGSPVLSPDGRWVAYTLRETN